MGTSTAYLAIDVVVIVAVLGGVALFRTPPQSRRGTLLASSAMLVAVVAVLVRMEIHWPELIVVALVLGSLAGLAVALRVTMIGMPAMIAFQHGAGALAALLVAFIELRRGASTGIGALAEVAGLAGLLVGAGTFSASLVAGGKLADILPSRPTVLRGHSWLSLGLSVLAVALAILAGFLSGLSLAVVLPLVVVAALLLGVVASVRIGGADMPVLISTLNATAGFAAAFCGIILESYLLVAAGATVAASGSVLTQVMCRAMNRNLFQVLAGVRPSARACAGNMGSSRPDGGPLPAAGVVADAFFSEAPATVDPHAAATKLLKSARRAIIVPGYGMAVAQAQFELASLAQKLEENGTDVKYAIHPVAGRMPGHMNVLLAEADVPYGHLVEMEQINPEFGEADLALVVGACDVVNPAAIDTADTPISGMPILRAMDAKAIVVCNYDDRPGYSGVENPLYRHRGSVLLWGDAKETLNKLNALLNEL